MLAFIKNNPTKKQIYWIKVFLFLSCLVPLSHLVWLGIQDNLSANPIEFIERSTGFWSLFILLATLTLTPIRLLTGKAWQIQTRRMLGLFMFFYVCLHIITYIWLDFAFDWLAITKDISKHPRILVGFAAFILSIPLAITSTNGMMKRLGFRWKQLHQTIYIIAILAVVHFWWLVKKDIREPLLYACILTILFGIRIYYKYIKSTKNGIRLSTNLP
jgi:sulfoxide reductase heme-binding subunit YedZ